MEKHIASLNKINLPDTLDNTLLQINGIMKSFNLPRDIIASDEEICYAWRENKGIS